MLRHLLYTPITVFGHIVWFVDILKIFCYVIACQPIRLSTQIKKILGQLQDSFRAVLRFYRNSSQEHSQEHLRNNPEINPEILVLIRIHAIIQATVMSYQSPHVTCQLNSVYSYPNRNFQDCPGIS